MLCRVRYSAKVHGVDYIIGEVVDVPEEVAGAWFQIGRAIEPVFEPAEMVPDEHEMPDEPAPESVEDE